MRSSVLPIVGAGIGIAFGLLAGCDRSAGRPPLCDGARPLRIERAERGEAPSQQEVEALIERMVDVAGGATRLRKLSFKRVEDLYLARTANPLGTGMIATTWCRPDETVRTLLSYVGGESEERLMKRAARTVRPRLGQMVAATGAAAQHVEWDWEVARLPGNLLDAEALEPLPPERVDGRLLIGVAVRLVDLNPPFEAWIDPEGPLLVEVRTDLPITADLSFRTSARHVQRFSDWRRVDGVLFPWRREIFVEGARIGLGEARSVELDREISDDDLLGSE